MNEDLDEEYYQPRVKELYRAFSFKLEERMSPDAPSDQLARIVVEDRKIEDHMKEELAELREHFEPLRIADDPDIRKLDVERQKLDDAWTKFRDILPPSARAELERPPAQFESIVTVMNGIENDWQLKKEKGAWGSAKKFLRRVSSTIHSHSTLLEILPADSQYVSIFCGTVQTLVKASANYEKIAAGLSRALLEITEAVAICAKECALYATKASIGGIARLYASIFCFLRNAIEWYTKKSVKRLLSSFREDFYEKFEDQIDNIKLQSALISREAQHASHAELRYLRLCSAKFEQNMGIGLQGLEREAAERREREMRVAEEKSRELENLRTLIADQSRLLHLVAHRTSALLQGQGSSLLSDLDTKSKGITEAMQSRRTTEDVTFNPLDDNKPPGVDELLLFSSHLEDHIDREHFMMEHDESSATYMDWQVVAALEEWVTAESQMLCIVGPNQVADTSPTTMIAREYVVSVSQANIPTISYFCELPWPLTGLQNGMTAEMRGLVSMTYALIRQLIELSPSVMSYTKDLGAHRFSKLDGSVESYNEAICVLGELLDLSPPMLFCIIDAFEALEDRSTMAHMSSFVKTLRGHRSYRGPVSPGSDRVLKILFTTAGRSRTLLTDLDEDELVFAERAGSAVNPGRPSVGRRSLSPTPLKALKPNAPP